MAAKTSNTPDIFISLAERLHRITKSNFQTFNNEQYKSIADQFIKDYFKFRRDISLENLHEMISKIAKVKSNVKRYVGNYKPEKPEFNPYSLDVDPLTKDEEIRRSLIEELSYYQKELNALYKDANTLVSFTDKSRLKFNMSIKQVVGLMGVLKKSNIIQASSNKELCDFIAQKFASIAKDEDYSVDRLPKLIVPDSETASKLIDTLADVQKQLQLIKNSKK